MSASRSLHLPHVHAQPQAAATAYGCAGKRTKYAYVGVRDLEACERIGAPMFGGFAKLELAKHGDSAIAGQLDHGPGKFGSEPIFVAAHSDPSQCDGEPCCIFLVLYSKGNGAA